MTTIEEIKIVLRESLQLGERVKAYTAGTPLLGSLPELDSMAVLTVLTAIEERFKITVADDEISADTFATIGSLCAYVDHKRVHARP
jgi:acyl carrier protein